MEFGVLIPGVLLPEKFQKECSFISDFLNTGRYSVPAFPDLPAIPLSEME